MASEIDTRRCTVCHEPRRTVAKVGPFLIKESCPNGCRSGYVHKVVEKPDQRARELMKRLQPKES
jgi:hypothetical protein